MSMTYRVSPQRINHRLIVGAMKINPIHSFDPRDDLGEEGWIDLDDAKLMAYDFYEAERAQRGMYARYVALGLIDIERPTAEHDHYIVCTIPSELAQRAYKYAKVGCDWDIERDRPDPVSAIRSLSYLSDFAESIKTFEALISLFPDDAEMIIRERGIFCLKSLQGQTQPRILTRHMRDRIDFIFEYAKKNHPEHIDIIENINCDYTMGLMSGTFDSAGTFERGNDSDWDIWNLDTLLEKNCNDAADAL